MDKEFIENPVEAYEKLKQEYERLKHDNGYEVGALEKTIDNLKAENDELKEIQKLLKEQMAFNKNELELNWSSEIKRCEFLLNELKKVDKQRDNWREQSEKLKQTLTEIKEIAETAAKCMYATYSDDYTEGYSWLGRIILQTISEVEDGV